MIQLEKKLSVQEWAELKECETVIKAGQQTFVEVGKALMAIRDGKLYREKYGTFAEYCEHRWGWKRAYAYKLIEATNVVKALPENVSHGIQNERTARAVADVPEEHRAEVVKAAAAAGSVTAKSIEKAAEKIVEAEIVHRDLTDMEREIPDKVVPLWLEAETLTKKLLALAHKIKSAMKNGIDNREDKRIWIDCTNGDLSGIQSIINTINLTVKPFAVCYVCNGHNPAQCRLCRGRGFIGRHLWTTAPVEIKTMLAKGKKK
jgi:hypothetical protein